jgi:hypothetical protein
MQRTDEVTAWVLEELVNDRVDDVVHRVEEVLVDRHLPASVVVRVCEHRNVQRVWLCETQRHQNCVRRPCAQPARRALNE